MARSGEGLSDRDREVKERGYKQFLQVVLPGAERVLQHHTQDVDITLFRAYSKDMHSGNLNGAARVGKLNEKQKHGVEEMRGIVAEAMMIDGIERGNWLGPAMSAIKTHPIDDYIRGVDIIMEAGRRAVGDQIMPDVLMGVDVTLSIDGVMSKIERRCRRLETKKNFSRIGYMHAEYEHGVKDFRIPTFGIWIPSDLFQEILKQYWNPEVPVASRSFQMHPIQDCLLYQIAAQVKVYRGIPQKDASRKALEDIDGYIRLCQSMRESTIARMDQDEIRQVEFMNSNFQKALSRIL